MVLEHTSWYGLLLWDTVPSMSPPHKVFVHKEVEKFVAAELIEHLQTESVYVTL